MVVWSKASVDSEWVVEEATIGKQRKVLLPIKIDEVVFPLGFTMRQTGNLIGWKGDVNHSEFIRLTGTIRELLRNTDAGQVNHKVEDATPAQPQDIRTAEQILGLASGWTQEDLKTAYRREAQRIHPDKWRWKPTHVYDVMEAEFKTIQQAYNSLKR